MKNKKTLLRCNSCPFSAAYITWLECSGGKGENEPAAAYIERGSCVKIKTLIREVQI